MTDGYLLVSHHPTILKGIIRRLEGKLATMLDDESFLAAKKALPKDAVGAVYLSTERLFRYLYSLALLFLPMAGDDLPFDTAAMPTAAAYAESSAGATRSASGGTGSAASCSRGIRLGWTLSGSCT